MLIIGELINTSRKAVKEAVDRKDGEYIKKLAQEQYDAGADYIDVNCGTMVNNEAEVMTWLVNCVQEQVDAPLCIDSPDANVLDTGLSLCKNGQPMLNSITDEGERFDTVLPILLKYKAKVVALCMDSTGMPETAEDRVKVARNLYKKMTDAGVPDDDIYFDPIIKPIGSVQTAGIEVIDAIKTIHEEFPKVHFTCGLSNISFGLPNRKLLNRLFAVQIMVAGMDGYVLDPTDKDMMGSLIASQTLLGEDEFNTDYLKAHRKGYYK